MEKELAPNFPEKSNFYLCQKIIRAKNCCASNLRIRQIIANVKLPRASNREYRQAVTRVKFSGARIQWTEPVMTARTEPVSTAPQLLALLALQPSPAL